MNTWVFRICTFLIPIFLIGCTFPVKSQPEEIDEIKEENISQDIDTLQEDKRIYQNNDPNSLVYLYVTILKQQESANNSVSFYDLNRWYDNHSIKTESPVLDVIIQEGDETGPKNGYLGFRNKIANATLNIRGNSSRNDVQKSYKIKQMIVWDYGKVKKFST